MCICTVVVQWWCVGTSVNVVACMDITHQPLYQRRTPPVPKNHNPIPKNHTACTKPPTADQATVDAAQAQLLESFKEYKKSFQQALVLFNKKPKKGLGVLQELGFVGTTPEDVARFLSKTQGLNKTTIGEYMGEKEDFAIKVMHAYTDALEFTDMTFDDALRCV